MLHFARGIALGVNVRDFLELQRAFEGDRVVDAAREIEEIGVAKELAGQRFVGSGLIGVQDRLDLVGDAGEVLHQSSGSFGGKGAAHVAQMKRDQHEGRELARKGLGGSHADFGAGVREDCAVGFAGNHRARDVANRQRFCALCLASRCAASVSAVSPD